MGGMITPVVNQSGFRFRLDDGDETAATWADALNVNPGEVPVGYQFRVRVILSEVAGGIARNTQYKVVERVNGGPWLTDTEPNRPLGGFESAHIPLNGGVAPPTTQQLTSGGFAAGYIVDAGHTSAPNTTIGANEETEIEIAYELLNSQYGVSYTGGDLIEVAFTYDDDTALDNYLQIPGFTSAVRAGYSNIYQGANQIAPGEIYVGGTQIQKVYVGSTEVYSTS